MVSAFGVLSLAIGLPILGGVVTLIVDRYDANHRVFTKWVALVFSIMTFLVTLQLYARFDLQLAGMQFTELRTWIEAFAIEYYLGIDGIAMPLIVLTAFITPLVILSAWEVIQVKVAQYMAAFLVMEGLMIGAFSSLDAILFYVFWEAMLIPMFLIIGIWGGPNRIYATIKFFLFTFFGSVLMLLALIYMRYQSGSFSILDFHQMHLNMVEQTWIFWAFLIAFAVKVPMWPVHTWLPDAHVEAPTGGSVILAAIMLKIGGYGFLRFSLPIVPDASMAFSWLIFVMSLIAVVYIGLIAMMQEDMKKLVAYSSIAHMGFATLGFFLPFGIQVAQGGNLSGAALAIEGGMVQMISHGFISAALFLCVGVMYDRMHTRQIKDYGGVVNTMPIFASFVVLFALANSGLPGTSGFVGEFMVILASMKSNFWIALLAATTLILSAAYSLWLVKRVIFGEIKNEAVAKLQDLGIREFTILAILAVVVIGLGLWPNPLVEVMHPSVDQLLQHIVTPKI